MVAAVGQDEDGDMISLQCFDESFSMPCIFGTPPGVKGSVSPRFREIVCGSRNVPMRCFRDVISSR
jgi:hypothetical protein